MSSSPEPEQDDTAAAMAAAMGFSNFGGPPSKKRRFNPHADAFTGKAAAAPPPPPPATSANSIPLHPRDTAAAAAATAPSSSSSSDEHLQAQIDAIVASGNATYGLETSPTDAAAAAAAQPVAHHGSSRHGGGFRPGAGKGNLSGLVAAAEFRPTAGAPGTTASASASSLPPRPASSEGGPGEGPSEGGGEWNGGEFFMNPKWYVGYYDPTTNENPWARLEAKMGLPPAPGTWLAAGASASSSSSNRGRGGRAG